MKKHGVLLSIVVSMTFIAASAAASSLPPTSVGAQKTSEPAAQPQVLKAAPAAASDPDAVRKSHAFTVNDVKGLLLTCVAPELDTNPDTDIFNSCTLAPGRTLDDVMHTFIGAIHFIQSEQAKERAEWQKDHEVESAEKPAQK